MQAGAAEHQPDIVQLDIVGDAAPQQLHHRAGAPARVDARAAQLQDTAGADDLAQIELVGAVEPAGGAGHLLAQQPIAADHRSLRIRGLLQVDDDQMIGKVVIAIEVTRGRCHRSTRLRPHLLIEDPVAQRLRRIDLGCRRGQPELQALQPTEDGHRQFPPAEREKRPAWE